MIGITAGIVYGNRNNQYSPIQVTTEVPLTLDIPAIHVHATVESVGLDSHRQMDVPKNPQDVAWYNLGSQPGEVGNAVIDGHVDTPTGAPAVFAKLKNVHLGDTIDVIERQHIKHEFVVTSIQDLPTAIFPTNRIFGPTTETRLNLITCAGTWDNNTSNYSERLVVFSKLVK